MDGLLKCATYSNYNDLSGLDIKYEDGRQIFLLGELLFYEVC